MVTFFSNTSLEKQRWIPDLTKPGTYYAISEELYVKIMSCGIDELAIYLIDPNLQVRQSAERRVFILKSQLATIPNPI